MPTKRGLLSLRNGSIVDLPRLIPSFTSKGFPFFEVNGRNGKYWLSDTTNALELIGGSINDSMLISAYDISYGFLRKPHRFYGKKELVIIDSGGYELADDFDLTEPRIYPHQPEEFTKEKHLEVLNNLPDGIPFVITNFDLESRGKLFGTQIRSARQLFNNFPNYLHDILLKPEVKSQLLNIDHLIGSIEELRTFDIIGLTEKETGNNLLDRLRTIATLRVELNRREVFAPIHIWGGLDPTMTVIYYMAGADIFDGVSWLRYAYHNGVAIQMNAVTIMDYEKYGIDTPKNHLLAHTMYNNIRFLQQLTIQLKAFTDKKGKSFAMFPKGTRDKMKRAFDDLRTVVPVVKEIYDGR